MKPLACLFAAALAACAPGARPAARAAAPAEADAAVASALEAVAAEKADYRIGAADLLSVTVFDNEKLNRDVRVAQDGGISFPLIGVVNVGGLTVLQAEALLAGKLKEYVIDPQVTVLIKTEGIKKVFVLGQVLKPCACELPTEGQLTVLGAISMAGGFSPIAAPNRTRVIRSVEGARRTFLIDVSAVTKRGGRAQDMVLQPDDVVFVPQSYF